MKSHFLILIIFMGVFFIAGFPVNSAKITRVSALKNKHLVVAAPEFPISVIVKRNATGHVINLGGIAPLIIEWLSRRFQFHYTILDNNITTIEDAGPYSPGLLSFVLNKSCDVIMGVVSPTPKRTTQLEFVHPWMYSPSGILIPMPEVSDNNVDAVIKPFNFWVWVGLIVAVLAIVITLWCFNIFQPRKTILKDKIKNFAMYILGTLLNQGGHLSSKKTTIRLVIGGWCLLVLVLLNTYNGTLISYVTAKRTAQPLVNSIQDVLTNPSIILVVDKGKGHDIVFSTADSGIYKALGDKLRSFPKSRCNLTTECVDMVKSLPHRHVYINAVAVLKVVIREEYHRSKKCQLSVAESEVTVGSNHAFGWVLAKKSPYLKEFNLGFLSLQDVGLIKFWEQELVTSRPCYNVKNNIKSTSSQNTKPLVRLTMGNLAGAFALLIVGSIISAVVFVMENIFYKYLRNGINIQ